MQMFVWACFGVVCAIVCPGPRFLHTHHPVSGNFPNVNQIDRMNNCPNGNDAIRIPYQLHPGVNDPEGIFAAYEKRVKTRMDKMDQLLKTDADSLHKLGVSIDVLTETRKALRDVLKGLQQLKTSDDMYEISHSDLADPGTGFTTVNPLNGCIEIQFGKGAEDQEVIGHEIRHGVQYERGEISITRGYKNGGKLYDINDEIDAYKCAHLTLYNKDPNIIVVDRLFVIKVNPDYEPLPRGYLRLRSKEGKRLRDRTRDAARKGVQNPEYYKGWKLDYRQGEVK
ncbi:MAG TPA: hypothetical protein VLD19_04945 [Chitinophagaceae bacterium]|nr:hypothetical protein [Chitinophagaceae bacterium]